MSTWVCCQQYNCITAQQQQLPRTQSCSKTQNGSGHTQCWCSVKLKGVANLLLGRGGVVQITVGQVINLHWSTRKQASCPVPTKFLLKYFDHFSLMEPGLKAYQVHHLMNWARHPGPGCSTRLKGFTFYKTENGIAKDPAIGLPQIIKSQAARSLHLGLCQEAITDQHN